MPPLPAGRYVSPPMSGRRGLTIAELLMRRGDIAARGAERSGQIWGGAVSDLGQIAGGAIREHGERKQEEERSAGINAAMQNFTGDLEGLGRDLSPFMEPERVLEVQNGMGTLQRTMKDLQEEKIPSREDTESQLLGVGALEKENPGYLQQNYAEVIGLMGPGLQAHFAFTPPPQWEEGVTQNLLAVYDQVHGKAPARPGTPEHFAGLEGPEREAALADIQARTTAARAPEKPFAQQVAEREALSAAGARGTAAGTPKAEGGVSAAGVGRPKSWYDTKEKKMLTLTDDKVLEMIADDPERLIDKVTGRNAMEEASTTEKMNDLIVDAKWRLRRMQELSPILDPIDFSVAWNSYRQMLGSLGQLFGRQVLRDVRVSEQDRAVYEATIGVPSLWVNLVDQREAWARLVLLERMMGNYQTKYGDAPEGMMASDFLTVKASSREQAEALVEDQIELLKRDYEQGGGVPQAGTGGSGGAQTIGRFTVEVE